MHFVRKDGESMKPPSNVKTPAQYIASLPVDRAKTIATVYEQSRLMTKAGQARMAKQAAPSASKGAARRVDTKRRPKTR
jgi:hypothetical protein